MHSEKEWVECTKVAAESLGNNAECVLCKNKLPIATITSCIALALIAIRR